ncbi:MAG TPA: sulfite reductase [Dehalococcoidia bacterium]|jgi:ferredoxin|nr:sulfite reductase [Dehalococcoidia bacterium]
MGQFLRREDLLPWLQGLAETRLLVAPRAVEGMVLFQPISHGAEIALDYTNSSLSPKEVVFPATDVLFTVGRKDGQTELVPATIERETVLFGIRPCDARGLKITDLPYLSSPTDAFYAQRRQKLILVGMACTQPSPTCFCTTFGLGPQDASDMDILLLPTEDGYIVDAVTDKGKGLLQGATLSETERGPQPVTHPEPLPIEHLVEAMRRTFQAMYWSRLADRCIHCHICAYVCPTCYCFDIRDYDNKGRIERIRTWESCQSAGFTRLAGGFDPRAEKGLRLRQRFAHKLLYFPQEFGPVACVGCGRCVVHCPVNIDIREVMADVQRLAQVPAIPEEA